MACVYKNPEEQIEARVKTFFPAWLWGRRLVRWPNLSALLLPLLPLEISPLGAYSVLVAVHHLKMHCRLIGLIWWMAFKNQLFSRDWEYLSSMGLMQFMVIIVSMALPYFLTILAVAVSPTSTPNYTLIIETQTWQNHPQRVHLLTTILGDRESKYPLTSPQVPN